MSNEWEEIKLGEILELITDYHSNGSYETLKENVELLDQKDFAIMIRTTNFEQNSFSDNLKYISKHSYYFLKKSMVYHGDIIMNKIANAGSVYFMPNLNYPVSLAMNLFLIRINKEKANQHFIFYYLKANESYIKQFAEGSVTKTITKNAVKNLIIRRPPIETQNIIVAIIESIENKIENLRRQNETLEAIAQTLFKHWFIDFEFPNADGKPYKSSGGAMIPSELGDIPEGWHVGKFSTFFDLFSGGTPKTSISEYWSGSIKWLSAKDVTRNHKHFVIETEKTITSKGLQKSAAKLLPIYTTVVSARGTVGNYCLLSQEMAISQSNFGVYPKSSNQVFFGHLLMSTLIERLKSQAYGSVFDTVTTSTFNGLYIVIPEFNLIEDFENKIKLIFHKILLSEKQIQTLTKTRDTLLPKLMSGQLRVKE